MKKSDPVLTAPLCTAELYHYSAEPFGGIEAVTQAGASFLKPRGLWVSVGEDWKDWCEGEAFGLDRLAHKTKIILAPGGANASYLRLCRHRPRHGGIRHR